MFIFRPSLVTQMLKYKLQSVELINAHPINIYSTKRAISYTHIASLFLSKVIIKSAKVIANIWIRSTINTRFADTWRISYNVLIKMLDVLYFKSSQIPYKSFCLIGLIFTYIVQSSRRAIKTTINLLKMSQFVYN